MLQRQPRLVIVAGPNGVGKSTYSRGAFATGFLLLDPDRYGISPSVQDPISAGRLVIRRVHDAIVAVEDIVLETTLSGKFPMKVLGEARRAGYDITLLYIGVDDPDECVRRVHTRVRLGGHDVPIGDIRRRYARSMENLPYAIDYASRVALYDNGANRAYRLVAQGDGIFLTVVEDVPSWAKNAVAVLRAREN
jgi:predicted ABC-type ATPase